MDTSRITPRATDTPSQNPFARGIEPILRALPLLLAALAVALLIAGCGPSQNDVDQARQEIRAALLAYLPRMAEAYRTGDVETLADQTTERERAVLHKQITELEQRGLTMDTELLDLTIEDLNLVSHATAYVTTAESWHVRVYAVGTDRLLREDPRQFSRVRYQLERERGHWTIMGRNRDPAINEP